MHQERSTRHMYTTNKHRSSAHLPVAAPHDANLHTQGRYTDLVDAPASCQSSPNKQWRFNRANRTIASQDFHMCVFFRKKIKLQSFPLKTTTWFFIFLPKPPTFTVFYVPETQLVQGGQELLFWICLRQIKATRNWIHMFKRKAKQWIHV